MSDQVRRSLCEAVDGSILMGHMQELARWVKLSGTPDELHSLRYFQAKLDEYGYRTNLLMHEAYISLPGKARVDVDNQALTSITHSFSRSSPAPGVTGRLVYVGDGDKADFTGRDLRGAIVLTEGIASPGQAAHASHAGAVGQVQISPHSICTRCAFRPSGAVLRAKRNTNSQPPSSALYRTPTAARCANASRAASSRR
jgi:hypothetical protein